MRAEPVRPHRIDELRFELAFPTERAALDGTAHWEAWLANRLLPIASEVFDEFSRPGWVRRLPALSVDLGELRPSAGDAELERRAREALRAAMQRALREAGGSDAPADRAMPHHAADLEALQRFLQQGTLPWGAQGAGAQDFDGLCARVLTASGPAFAAWWRAVTHDARIVRRFAHQASPDALHRLVALLAPGRESFLVALAVAVERLLSAPEIARGREGARATAWEAVLVAATVTASGTFAPGVIAQRVLTVAARLRAGDGEGPERTLAALAGHLAQAAVPEPDPGGAFHALKSAATRQAATPQADASERLQAAAQWRATLERAVSRGDPRAVRNAWPRLVREQAPLVLAVVRLRGRLARVRRRLAEGFPEPMLGDLVRLLEPIHAAFIVDIVHRPELFQAAPPPAPAPEALRRRLWEFTLGYLLVERGGRFNKHDYLGSLLRQQAAHDNLAWDDLVRGLVGLLDAVTAPSPLQGEMLALLRELLARRPADPSWRAAVGASQAEAELYDALVNRPRPRDKGLRELRRDALARARNGHPEVWRRFRAALTASGEPGGQPRLEGWTAGELAELVEAFVLSEPGGSSAGARLLCASVVARVPRGSGRHRRALMRVVQALARRVPVDVESVVESLGEPDVAPSAPTLQARVAAWLGGADDPGVPRHWSAWRRRRGRDLRAVLLVRGRDAAVRRTLAARASEPMLIDVVHLVAPEAAGFVTATVRDPGAFRTPASAGRPLHETQRDLWLFTLGYLLAERGSGFNRRSYLASLLRQQAAHENRSVQALARALLAVLDVRPGRDPVRRELTDVLHALLSDTKPHLVEAASPDRAAPDRRAAREARRRARADALRVATERPGDLVARWLRSGAMPAGLDRRVLREAFERAFRDGPQALLAMLRPHLERRVAIRRLAALLPEAVLVRMLLRLRPEDAPAILRDAGVLAPAVTRALAGRAAAEPSGRALPAAARATARRTWRFLLEHLFREGRGFDPAQFASGLVRWWHRRAGVAVDGVTVTRLLEALREGPFTRARLDALADAFADLHLPGADEGTNAAAELREGLGGMAGRDVTEAGRRAFDEARRGHADDHEGRHRQGTREPLVRDPVPPREAAPVTGEAEAREALTVADAGQVLASPYLPRLFAMLDLVAGNAFVSPDAAHRAVHVLQFLVFGTTGAPESELALGKLLCGVPLDEPIPRDLPLASRETDAVEGLLRGMIQNWKAVGHTSVAGLRETFLQREGRLVREDEAWRLTVAPRAFDMLIDRLPWGFSIIRHPWMPAMLQVDWR